MGERWAVSESFRSFHAKPYTLYIYRQYCIYPAIKVTKTPNVIQFNNKERY
jgi:hypothetical protein